MINCFLKNLKLKYFNVVDQILRCLVESQYYIWKESKLLLISYFDSN